jgi:hypothetical protein
MPLETIGEETTLSPEFGKVIYQPSGFIAALAEANETVLAFSV